MKIVNFRLDEERIAKLHDLKERWHLASLTEVFRRLVEEAWKREKRR